MARSVDSATAWPIFYGDDNEEDESPLLPGSDNVYLTRTKDGKPAFGRKKPGKLLENFGFDIMGQSLGVPSLRDFERQSRPLSMNSQSSGVITVAGIHRRGRESQRLDNSTHVLPYEDYDTPPLSRKASMRSLYAPPAHSAMAQYNNEDIANSHQYATHRRSTTFLPRRAFNLPLPLPLPLPPPPPPPPPSAVMGCQDYPTLNSGRTPVQMGCHTDRDSRAYMAHSMPSYPYRGFTTFQSAPNWEHPTQHRTQQYMSSQYPNSLGIPLPHGQAGTIPPYYQQFMPPPQPVCHPQAQAMPAVNPVNIPPPPQGQQEWLQNYAIATGRSGVSMHVTNWGGNFDTGTMQTSQVGNTSRRPGSIHGKGLVGAHGRRPSRRIRHVHVCAGCGKKRSRGYHRDNPLKRGEIPKVDYCRKCVRDAEYTDSEASNTDASDGADDVSTKKDLKTPDKDHATLSEDNRASQNLRKLRMVALSTDEERAIASGEYVYDSSRQGGRWIKKSKSRGIFKRLFSRRTDLDSFPLPPSSGSSAEESRSRASSPLSDSYPIRSFHKTPRSSARRGRKGVNRGSIAVEEEPVDLPRPRKHKSPLVPRETDSKLAENEACIQSPSKPAPTFAQRRSRSRIPRPQSQSQSDLHLRQVPAEHPSLIDTSTSLPVSDVNSNQLCLETEDVANVVPVSQPTNMEPRSESPNQPFTNEPSLTTTQPHNQESSSEKLNDVLVTSSKTVSCENTPGEAPPPGVQPPRNEFPNRRATVASDVSTNESVRKPMYESDEIRVRFEHKVQFDPELPTNFHAFPASVDYEDPSLVDDLPELVYEPNRRYHWEEPLTPKDLPYAAGFDPPHFANSSWSDLHTDMDQQVEEMAEQDLAAAGKLFDGFSSAMAGSATSTFPTGSYTRSNISIESYDSDSGVEGTESGETAKAKQIGA